MSLEEAEEYGRLFETAEGARVFVRILRESLDPREHAQVIDLLRAHRAGGVAFPCPTLVLYAREDRMVPPEFGPRFAEDIPGAELRWIEDASHFLHVDAPERTVEEIRRFCGP
jgi:pimeloyl-ACP methyl ester carboxylesterase